MNETKNDILNKVPKGWVPYRLGEVIILVNGRAYGKDELLAEGKYKVIRIQNLNGGESWYYSSLELDENKYCHEGDLLFAWSTTFGPYYWYKEKAIFHYHIWNLILSEKIDKRFAYYYLLEITEELKKSSHGVAMLHITKSGMEGWHFPLPSMLEQKLIATQLENLFVRTDKAISLIQANLEHIKHLLPSALNDVFKQEDDAMEQVSLVKYVEFIGGSQPAKDEFSYEEKDGYIRLIQIRDYKTNDHKVYIKKESARRFCEVDDIMIGRYGPPVFQILRGLQGAYNVALMKAVPNEQRISKDYLYWFLQSPDIQNYIIGISQRAAGQSGVNKDALEKYKISIPSLSIQKQAVQYLNELILKRQQLHKRYTQKLQQLKSLKESLLEAAFRGELKQQAANRKAIQLQPQTFSLVAESEAVYQTSVPLKIQRERAVARVVLAAKIISLHQTDENWTRIKFQKLLYLAEHIIKPDWEMKYFIQTAGPLDNHFLYDELQPALKKKKWFQEVDYRYYPLAKVEGVDKEYNHYFKQVDDRLSKLFKSFLKATEAQSEIAATLYAVWNNLIIQKQAISDERIIENFYKWSERKEQYKQGQLVSALKWMRENDLVPTGFGKEIKKAKK